VSELFRRYCARVHNAMSASASTDGVWGCSHVVLRRNGSAMAIPHRVKRRVPARLRPLLRAMLRFVTDFGSKSPTQRPVPPRHLRLSSASRDFLRYGALFAQLLVDLGGLEPNDRILDVGSGCGRTALPLTTVLSDGGSYSGFDINKPAVDWCIDYVQPLHSGFTFKWIDLDSPLYNRGGSGQSSAFSFPYPDGEFDFVYSVSLFTHLMEETTSRYIREMARVLRPGGRLFNTFFLLNEHSREAVARNAATFSFDTVASENAAVADRHEPEAAVAYDEGWIRSTYASAGLTVTNVSYGTWSGRASGRTGQDIIVATKQRS
jgi:SAM-dependent methyltransferase